VCLRGVLCRSHWCQEVQPQEAHQVPHTDVWVGVAERGTLGVARVAQVEQPAASREVVCAARLLRVFTPAAVLVQAIVRALVHHWDDKGSKSSAFKARYPEAGGLVGIVSTLLQGIKPGRIIYLVCVRHCLACLQRVAVHECWLSACGACSRCRVAPCPTALW